MEPTAIYSNLYVGHQEHFEQVVSRQDGWAVVHACKIPYHKLLVGYTQAALPNTHPEYLFARRGHRLALNMIDGPDPRYTNHAMIDVALDFIHEQLWAEQKVLVHCNQGHSRGPSIGMLYLIKHTNALPKNSLEDAERAYKNLYPNYSPMAGIRGYIENNWSRFTQAD